MYNFVLGFCFKLNRSFLEHYSTLQYFLHLIFGVLAHVHELYSIFSHDREESLLLLFVTTVELVTW